MALTGKQGLAVSPWTGRRWRPAWGWGWKRATLVATAAEPQRVERLAQIRLSAEPVQAHAVRVLAAALDLHLWPQVGAAWMPTGRQEDVMTPGTNAKFSLAGALHLTTGEIG